MFVCNKSKSFNTFRAPFEYGTLDFLVGERLNQAKFIRSPIESGRIDIFVYDKSNVCNIVRAQTDS